MDPAGVRAPEYWIVNLESRALEVYREPEGAGHRQQLTKAGEDAVAPLFAPQARVRVSDLLP